MSGNHSFFVDNVCKALLSHNHYIYRTNMKVCGNMSIVDILLYKTFVLCKQNLCNSIKHSKTYLSLERRIEQLKTHFFDHQIFIIYDGDLLENEYDLEIPNDHFVHINNIDKINAKLTHPKLRVEYCHPLFSLVSNLNTSSRHEHLYKYIYTTPEVIERCYAILNDKEEIERFNELQKYINIVETIPDECINLQTYNLPTTYYMRLTNYSLTSTKKLKC